MSVMNESSKGAFTSLIKESEEMSLRMMQGDFDSMHQYGFFYEKFKKMDSRLFEIIFPYIEQRLENEKFQDEICTLFRKGKETDISNAKAKGVKAATHGADDHISRTIAESYSELLSGLNFKKLLDYYSGIFESLDHYGSSSLGVDVTKENYCLYNIAELLFNHEKALADDRFPSKEGSKLELYYDSKGISLSEIDSQYKKYGLLSVGSRFSLSVSETPKLKDSALDTYLFLRDARPDILRLFESLMGSGNISNLALLPDYNFAGDGILDITYALEELEYGKIFSLANADIVPLSKLYDLDNQQDSLWVKIDKSNITFEELLDDFDVHDDSIVTQVVHLEYIDKDGELFIQHIDHEYIFYTELEYEVRQKNGCQKGSAVTRVKTFKVDGSRIPLYLGDGSFFLYLVLSEYFKKIDLLAEYFETVLK